MITAFFYKCKYLSLLLLPACLPHIKAHKSIHLMKKKSRIILSRVIRERSREILKVFCVVPLTRSKDSRENACALTTAHWTAPCVYVSFCNVLFCTKLSFLTLSFLVFSLCSLSRVYLPRDFTHWHTFITHDQKKRRKKATLFSLFHSLISNRVELSSIQVTLSVDLDDL